MNSQPLAQIPIEISPCAEYPRLDCAFRDSKDFCGFFSNHLRNLVQIDHPPQYRIAFHRIDRVVVTLSRVSVLGRPYFFEEPGGNCLSNFSTPLFRFWMFLLELLEIVSLELPLHTSRFVFVSNRSTTNVPTLYVSVVVVASPKPPPPKPLQPQPPPNPS